MHYGTTIYGSREGAVFRSTDATVRCVGFLMGSACLLDASRPESQSYW